MEALTEIISDFFNSIGQPRSFGDVGFDVRFARKWTRLRIYEYTPLVRTQTGCVRCAAIVPARAVRACATVSWRPPEIPEAICPMMGRRGRAHARDNDTGGRR
jgi:hypothetical protein